MAKSWKSFLPPDPPSIDGEDLPFGGNEPANAIEEDDTLKGLFAERDQLAQKMQGLISPQADSQKWPEILSIPEKRKLERKWEEGRKRLKEKIRAKGKELSERSRKKLGEVWLSKREKWLETYQRENSTIKEWESRQAKILQKYKEAKKEVEKLKSFRKQLDDFQQRAEEMRGSDGGDPSFLSDQKFLPDELDKRLNAAREKYSAKKKYLDEAEKLLEPGGLMRFAEQRGKQLAASLGSRLESLSLERKIAKEEEKKQEEKRSEISESSKQGSLFNRREERKKEEKREARKEKRKAERKEQKAEQDKYDRAEQEKDDAKREQRKRQRMEEFEALGAIPKPPEAEMEEKDQKKREGTLKERLAARKEERNAKRQEEGKAEKKKLNLSFNRKNKR